MKHGSLARRERAAVTFWIAPPDSERLRASVARAALRPARSIGGRSANSGPSPTRSRDRHRRQHARARFRHGRVGAGDPGGRGPVRDRWRHRRRWRRAAAGRSRLLELPLTPHLPVNGERGRTASAAALASSRAAPHPTSPRERGEGPRSGFPHLSPLRYPRAVRWAPLPVRAVAPRSLRALRSVRTAATRRGWRRPGRRRSRTSPSFRRGLRRRAPVSRWRG